MFEPFTSTPPDLRINRRDALQQGDVATLPQPGSLEYIGALILANLDSVLQPPIQGDQPLGDKFDTGLFYRFQNP